MVLSRLYPQNASHFETLSVYAQRTAASGGKNAPNGQVFFNVRITSYLKKKS